MVFKIIKDHYSEKFSNFKYNMSEKYGNWLTMRYIKLKMQLWYLIVRDFIKDSIKWIDSHRGLSIFLGTALLCIITRDFDTYALWGSVLFLLTFISKIFNFYKEKETSDKTDLQFYVDHIVSKQDILDEYVDKCFDNVLILTRGFLDNTYIRAVEEKQIREDLLNELAKNLSPSIKDRLEYYYGKDRVAELLAEKAYIKVSLFVADKNKVIYKNNEETPTSKILKSLM